MLAFLTLHLFQVAMASYLEQKARMCRASSFQNNWKKLHAAVPKFDLRSWNLSIDLSSI